MKGASGHPSIRRRLIQLLSLPLLSLAGQAVHAETAGFTTPFNPESWLVVNTTGGVVDETLAYSAFMCAGSAVENPGTNQVACVAAYAAEGINNDVNLIGSNGGVPPTFDGDPPQEVDPGFDVPGGGLQGTSRSTTLVFTNTYWRPYLVSFDWSFTQAGDTGNEYVMNGQNVSFLVNPGFISPNGDSGTTYSYTSDPGLAYPNSTGWLAYVPPGATLSFSINTTTNDGDPGVLTIKGFTTTEVPAPLPITGSGAVLLYSRRLRRRTSQPPALHPSTGKLLSLAEQRASHQRQLALKHYGTILGGPVQPVLPSSRSTTKS